jgi:hypothetical protein
VPSFIDDPLEVVPITHTRIRRDPNRNPRWTSNLPMPSGYFELALRVFGGTKHERR